MTYKSIFTYGFAIFAMFFGSGNLVFPLQIGHASADDWFMGFLGLLITGIALPFLGLFVIKLHRGNCNAFFGEAGKVARVILPLFILSLLGSFGVVPRCITVAYGGISPIFPEISLTLFSIIFSMATFFFCLKDSLMVKILGVWLSPILLGTLSLLIAMGIYRAESLVEHTGAQEAFIQGFLSGYQTMDLFAAFFFSALIFSQIQHMMPKTDNHREIIRSAIKPSIVGALMLALVYLGFVFLGAHYSFLIKNVSPELMLPTIARHTMGSYATLFIGVAMVLSCLTTAVALNNIYARYLSSLFKSNNKYFYWILLGTTGISFAMSLLDFKGISRFLSPVLEASYPGLIALTVMSIFWKGHKQIKMVLFYGITFFMVLYSI